jgi:hypothetical protein
MMLSEATGAIKKFRRTSWKFQQTFLTPMKHLQTYVAAIVVANQEIKSGCLTIEQTVFEPAHLIRLLQKSSLPTRYASGTSFTPTGHEEVEALLLTVFSDWVDFIFVPTPKSFAIYADHDEYTTFLAHTRSSLNGVANALVNKGFTVIANYERRL